MTANASRPKLLLLVLCLLAATWSVAGTANAASSTGRAALLANTTQDAFDEQMLGLMNNARAAAGAPALKASTGLRNLALSWSTNMANGGTGGVLAHNPNVRASLPNYGASSATGWAENVATWAPGNGRDAASVFTLYMNSPGHRANILNPAMRFVGIGTVISGSNVGWNTQNFTDKVDQAAAPIGTFDSATVSGSNVNITGWALEPADKTRQIPVHVYINGPAGTTGTALTTTGYRPDVNNAFGATGNHGFSASLPLPTGTSSVCAFAISTLGADNTLLACRTVTRAATPPPTGYFDSATVSGSAVNVVGWALEPADKTRQIPVHVYINNPAGNTGTALTTTRYRPDVNNAFGATGNHGFSASLPLPTGTSSVCAFAISTLGADNTLLACRTVSR